MCAKTKPMEDKWTVCYPQDDGTVNYIGTVMAFTRIAAKHAAKRRFGKRENYICELTVANTAKESVNAQSN
jgi:hypothetical protein